MKRVQRYALIKAILMLGGMLGSFYISFAFAQDQTLGGIASNIQSSFDNLAKLITAGSFIAGLGFAVGSILKFKAHKDNPTQIPIGTPIALLLVAAALLFMPSVFKVAGKTIFGSTPTSAGISGVSGITS